MFSNRTGSGPSWLVPATNDALALLLHVQPGAKHTLVKGEHGERLKIALASPPVDGKANAELEKFLSRTLDLPRSAVKLTMGEKCREKRVELSGIDPKTVLERLTPKD